MKWTVLAVVLRSFITAQKWGRSCYEMGCASKDVKVQDLSKAVCCECRVWCWTSTLIEWVVWMQVTGKINETHNFVKIQ